MGALVSLLEEESSIVRQRMLRIWVEGRLRSPGVQMHCCRSRRRVDAHLLIGDAAAATMLCTDQRLAELSIHAVVYRLQRVLARACRVSCSQRGEIAPSDSEGEGRFSPHECSSKGRYLSAGTVTVTASFLSLAPPPPKCCSCRCCSARRLKLLTSAETVALLLNGIGFIVTLRLSQKMLVAR